MTKTFLPTRPLGQTGFEIPHVGFGAWAAGGNWIFGRGQQDGAQSVAAIEATGAGQRPAHPRMQPVRGQSR